MAPKPGILDARSWHFPAEGLAFLEELKANNSRDWFAQNKATYERAVKRPAAVFCSLVESELANLTGRKHTSKVFRIHRDVRFSKDKTPYNVHLHISFLPVQPEGTPPAWHFGLGLEKLSLGAGTFAFDKPVLEAYRSRVGGAEGVRLGDLLSTLRRDGVRIGEPELKRVPAGFESDHPSGDLLRRKGLSAWIDIDDPSVATETGIVTSCAESFRRLKPVFDWLLAL